MPDAVIQRLVMMVVYSGVYKHLCEHAYKKTSYTLQF